MTKEAEKVFLEAGSRPLLSSQVGRHREFNLPPGMFSKGSVFFFWKLFNILCVSGCNYLYEKSHETHMSSCVVSLFQSGLESSRENVSLELLEHIVNEPCFNQLRTQEQLGYVVFSGLRRSAGTQGLQILVQSDRHPQYVQSRIDAFLGHLQVRR